MAPTRKKSRGSVEIDNPDSEGTKQEDNETTGKRLSSIPHSVSEDRTTRKNRKQMAWVALTSCIVVMFCAMFFVPVAKLKVLGEVFTWFYFCMVSIVGSYIGFSTVFDAKSKK